MQGTKVVFAFEPKDSILPETFKATSFINNWSKVILLHYFSIVDTPIVDMPIHSASERPNNFLSWQSGSDHIS